MNYIHKSIIALVSVSLIIASCKKDEEEIICTPSSNLMNTIPEFYKASSPDTYGSSAPDYTVIAGSAQQISSPQDIDFHPGANRTHELWVVNKGTENTGSSTVIIHNAGQAAQTTEYRKDANSWHFMSLTTALAFSSENGNFATSPGVFSANHNSVPFTGPALWSGDLNVYAKPSGGNGSHLDMLHESPYSMGIAHEEGNIFWVFDGYSSQIVKYDFAGDHGPGNSNHDNGIVHRYLGISVKRKVGVPSHMVIHKKHKWMYICDTGNKRILRMKINTGNKKRDLSMLYEQLAQRWEMENVTWEVFASTNLTDPCGIEVIGNRLFVSDNATNEIIAYDVNSKQEIGRIQTNATKIKGIKLGPDGKLWYVDYASNNVVRIDPK